MAKTPPDYKGVRVQEVSTEMINKIYVDKTIDLPDRRSTYYPNQFVYLKSNTQEKSGAITRVTKDGNSLQLIPADDKLKAVGLSPLNKEQKMAMTNLLDDQIQLCIMTGRAGTGKTMLTLAAALRKVEEKKYDRIILTKPMSQVGKYELGALPGEVQDKFGPYLDNYMNNIVQIMPNKKSIPDLIDMYNIEFVPLQLIRGCSWTDSFIIADEVQVLDHHEMLTLGTRVGKNSKMVIMGDLGQRDEDIARNKTGLHKIINDEKMKKSHLTSHIELIKCERSELSQLFSSVFEPQDDTEE